MKCAEVCRDLGAFVLGGLEPEEAVEIRRHLASCSDCRNELEELEKINQVLKAAPPPIDPPDHLKDEILSRVRGEKPPSSRKNLRFIPPAVAAAALLVVTTLGIFFSLQEKPPVAVVQLNPTAAALQEGNEHYWGVAELRPQPLGNQLVELKLNNLDEPEPDSFYEMWFVSGENHISAGTFTTTGLGETEVWLTVPPEARDYRTLLITEESVADDSAPSEEVVLRGEMP